jgi:signal peptidase I
MTMRDANMMKRKRRWRLGLFLAIPLAGVGSWLAWGGMIYAASLRLYIIPTNSMAPTLVKGDRFFVDTRAGNTPRRGELWVHWLPGRTLGVKRVVGLPGETIAVAGGRVWIDGKPLAEPYLTGPIGYTMAPVVLKEGEYFMLGDNRAASFDSHVWGPLAKTQFVGRVEFRPWPPSRLSRIR